MNIIDFQNGNFKITDEIIVGRGKDYNSILKLAPKNKTWDIENGFKWIYFNDIEIDNLFFNIGVCFHNDILVLIDFGFTKKQQEKIPWDNWNEEDELKRKDIYEEWLTKLIGKKRNFEWGRIGAYFDPRRGTSFMNINYKKKTRPHNTGDNLWLLPAHSENLIGFSSGLGFVCYISCSIHATAHSRQTLYTI